MAPMHYLTSIGKENFRNAIDCHICNDITSELLVGLMTLVLQAIFHNLIISD